MNDADLPPAIVRRTLHDGPLLQVGHIVVRPTSSGCGDLETSERNVLALPLAGVFAKHDGPREHAIATPSHAVLISARKPYRLSFPGRIGDHCLALRFDSAALARAMPEAMSGDGFDAASFASHALLPPGVLLARSQLWARLSRGAIDVLDLEERCIGLLDAALRAARRTRPSHGRGRVTATGSARRLRQLGHTLEALSADPERRWSLGDLADHAGLSACHLAHVFRAEMGISVYGYVVRSRLARALDAVLDTDAGLTEIALDAGFASHSHFTARFRALFGLTPQDLRRQTRAATARELRRIVTAREAVAA